ncbi:MAG: hypothetical protein K6T78_16150 [Alicyclobacillus sp.]|nr:hypothetical protein [Alicyclobacillus sp.]
MIIGIETGVSEARRNEKELRWRIQSQARSAQEKYGEDTEIKVYYTESVPSSFDDMGEGRVDEVWFLSGRVALPAGYTNPWDLPEEEWFDNEAIKRRMNRT